MNTFLQENLFTLIVFLLLIIFLLIGILFYVIFKLLASKQGVQKPTSELPVTESLKREHQQVIEKYVCHNHKDQPTIGSCLICEDVFCEKCLIEHEGMFFCRDHFKIYANSKWKQITDLKTTPHTPDDGLFIYEYKRKTWSQKGIPSFVLTHYKINVEDDLIESYIQLHVREEDAFDFEKGLSDLVK